MKINIKTTDIELTPAISDYVYKRIFTIEKYFGAGGANAIAQVEVGKNTRHHKVGNIFHAEVHIIGAGLDLYAVSDTEDLYAAIDIVRDEIVRNVIKSKGKHQTLTRKGAEMMKNMMKGIVNGFKRRK